MNPRRLARLIQLFRYLGYASGLIGVLLVTGGRSWVSPERSEVTLTVGGILVATMLICFLMTYVLRTLLFLLKGRSLPPDEH